MAQKGEDLGADFLKGYDSSTPESANAPNYPGNQVWEGVGARAEAYKAHWKNKPGLFPYGSNDEGGK